MGKLIRYEDIIQYGKTLGLEITWRKVNYYRTLGLLPHAFKVGKKVKGKTTMGRKAVYPAEAFLDLVTYNFLQNNLGFTLEEIKQLIGKVKFDYIENEIGGLIYVNPVTTWVRATYSAFLSLYYKEVDDYIKTDGVLSMQMLNSIYKEQLLKVGVPDFRERIKKVGQESQALDLSKEAKEWAQAIAQDFQVKLTEVGDVEWWSP